MSVYNGTEECSRGYNAMTIKNKVNLIFALDSNIVMPYKHYHQI